MSPTDLNANLVRLRGELLKHRDLCNACLSRHNTSLGQAIPLAMNLPLSLATSSDALESIWGAQTIKSQRDLNGGLSKKKSDGSYTDEVILHTDDDVFFFAGPFRYPVNSGPCGLIFSPEIESKLSNRKIATPFDSGGLLNHFKPLNTSLTPIEFVRANEMPVPDYRTYLGEFIATTFHEPTDYLHDDNAPACDTPMLVKSKDPNADARQWTFEVRCQGPVPMDAPLMAIIIERALAQSGDWAEDMMMVLKSRGVVFTLFDTVDGSDWEILKEQGQKFLDQHIRQVVTHGPL